MKGIIGMVMSLLGGLIAISGTLMMLSLFEKLITDNKILILVDSIYLIIIGVAVFVLSKKMGED
jgi:hypothetical protein